MSHAFFLNSKNVAIFKVKFWIMFNEPQVFIDKMAFPENCMDKCPYQVGHNVIKAHAKVWHMYENDYRKTQNGMNLKIAS